MLAKVLSLDSDASCLRRKALLRRKQHVTSSEDTSFLAPAPLQHNKHREVAASARKQQQHQQQRQQEQEQHRPPSPPPPQTPPEQHNFFSTSADEFDDHHHQQQHNASAPSPASAPVPVLDRADLQQKRQDDIDAQVAHALAEKHEVSDDFPSSSFFIFLFVST